MPPLAPKRSFKTSHKAFKNASTSKKDLKPNSNTSPSIPRHFSDEGSSECFLIPAAIPQKPHSTESPSESRKISLQSISSNFYSLPVRRQDQTESYIYISPRASFPTTSSTESLPSTSAEDGRTLFLTNLARDTVAEDLKSLFSNVLQSNESDIEAVVQIPQDRSSEGLRVNLMRRECTSTPSPSQKALRKNTKKASKDDTNELTIPALMPDPTASFATSLSARLLPNAYVRFKSSDQLHQILMLQSSSLPLQWPTPQASGSTSWLDGHRALRALVRPSSEIVTSHTDAWMNAFDAGLVTPLSSLLGNTEPTKSTDKSEALADKTYPVAAVNEAQDDDDDGGGWTIVTRGGQHGRSSTIPTQHSETRTGADPYAQSSMAGRDAGAAVKVMKRGFAQAFSQEEAEVQNDRKRKGGELNTSFYRTNIADSKKAKMNELKRKFEEDKARVERMRNSRKFKPY